MSSPSSSSSPLPASSALPSALVPSASTSVDVLFLGVHCGAIDAAAVGPTLATRALLDARFECVSEMQLEAQPEWSFCCFVRKGYEAAL